MIKTIIFDLGNVIVNVNRNEQFKKLAIDSNKTVSYVKRHYSDKSQLVKPFQIGKINQKEFYAKAVKELNLRMNYSNFKKMWCDIFALNKDIEMLVRTLKRNFRLILLSNTNILHFEYVKNKYKIIDIFDEYVLSYKAGYMKPNPLIYLYALRKAKALPFNCVYIDDIPEFVYVARLMGIRAFRYKNYEKLVNDLSKVKIM